MEKECRYCTHWEPLEYLIGEIKVRENAVYGRCDGIRQFLEITILAGWDGGVVNQIHTDPDFYCKGFERE